MENLTALTRAVCEELVRGHLPDEAKHFDSIWRAFWEAVGCRGVDELSTKSRWRVHEAPVFDLGATGGAPGQALDTLYLVGAIATATSTLLRECAHGDMTTADIARVLAAGAVHVGAPEHVRRVLEQYGLGLLAEQLGAVDWEGRRGASASAVGDRVWVQWWIGGTDDGEILGGQRDFVEVGRVRREFEPRKRDFTLYIDERSPAILVHVPGEEQAKGLQVPWHKLQAHHAVLLGMILGALQEPGSIVTYHDIALWALKDKTANVELARPSIRRAKSELNARLGHILGGVVRPQKGGDYYYVGERISYCWIRPDPDRSRLLPGGLSAPRRGSE